MREFLQQLAQVFNLPPEIAFLLYGIIVFTALAVVGQGSAAFMVLMERKVLAWLTQRKGPNRVGPYGVLQTVADGVKLLFKEDIMNPGQDKLLFSLGPAIFLFPVYITYMMLPFTNVLVGIDLTVGLLFVFALSSLSVVGIVLAGWASNNKYSLLGGMRSAAQAISYEIPLIMSALTVALAAGSLNIKDIVESQNGAFGAASWYILVLGPLAFILFYVCSIAEVNRIPFDLPEAESELVSGYNTEYSGMKFAMFFLAEYSSLFGMSALITALFLGGYYSPLGGLIIEKLPFASTLPSMFKTVLAQLEMATWFIGKTYILIAIAMWLRGTLPRLKPDQLMGFSWKFLIPLSLVNLIVVTFLKYSWMFNGFEIKVANFTFNGYYLVMYGICSMLVLTVLLLMGSIFKKEIPVSNAVKQKLKTA